MMTSSMDGKTCLITGANSGLGLATAKRWAALGADLILVCRDEQKAAAALAEVKSIVPRASLSAMVCDLSSMASIERFIADFKTAHSKLDLLFNNAAVLKPKRTLSTDGIELMFQTNYLAPFVITTSLLDILKNNAPAQVINIAHPPENLTLDFEDIQSSRKYNVMDAFMKTKLCLLLFTLELAQRISGSGVTVNAGDPGPFKSKLSRDVPWPLGTLLSMTAPSADQAAGALVFMAGQSNGSSGKVFLKEQEIPQVAYWKDGSVRARLWTETETILERIRISR
jgi:NAD(P)-dependent dehydrogenase (short-subunit alcohol dehydrogenase family)